ncbi:MAG: GNAT family N-acetyltransferase [Flavobacteriales bacterium]|jgi:predicted GNAT family N-acyltransferase|nr:GNAT family N-acetyltransferase [Flavobacteriales bacterium]MBT5089981.1 GNAT family N-acetyltransferase [Flavobacteriales bacterium]MBT5750882.1 GNAT family N-acetyltransferase [Flavobacteriales bacterium]
MIEIKKFRFKDEELMKKAHKIRYDVFVIGQDCSEELEWEFEEESTHFLLIENDIPLATARYRKTDNGFKLERFAVLSQARGKGFGMLILKAILEDIKDINALKYMHAQEQVTPFYEKVGFKKSGNIFEEAGIMHYKMEYRA